MADERIKLRTEQRPTGYYRNWCNTLALVYDYLTGALGALVGGEKRFRAKIVSAAAIQPGDRVLDVGCGTGTLAVLIAKRVGEEGEVVGVDLSSRMLAAARRKSKLPQLVFQHANAEELPSSDSYFDTVTVTYVLHEMPRRARRNTLREIRRVLKPEGNLVVVDLHRPQSWWRRAVFRLFMLFENETAWDFLRTGLQHELEEAGFQSIRRTFLVRDFVPLTMATSPRGDTETEAAEQIPKSGECRNAEEGS